MANDSQLADILELIDRLEAQVTDRRRVLGTNRVMVEEGEFLAILDRLRRSLPLEVQQARRVVQDRQKVILDAQTEAEKIIATAKHRAEYLISENGLTAEARYRSEDALREGRETTKKLAEGVHAYCEEVLDRVDRLLRENMKEIDAVRGSLPRGPKQLTSDRALDVRR